MILLLYYLTTDFPISELKKDARVIVKSSNVISFQKAKKKKKLVIKIISLVYGV